MRRRKFFEIFSWVFTRSTHQGASIELSFVLFGSVGTSEKKFFLIKKKLVTVFKSLCLSMSFYYPLIRWSAWGVDQLRLVEVSKVAFSFCPSHQRAVESKRNWLRGCGFWHLAKLYSNAAIFICLKIFSFVLTKKNLQLQNFQDFFYFPSSRNGMKNCARKFYYSKI